MTDFLGNLGNLAELGPDMLLTVLSEVVGAVGTGTEWTGEQIDKLGDLEQQLAQKLTELRNK